MSIKIWCEKCEGTGSISADAGCGCCYEDAPCPSCWDETTKRSLGYIFKGCENCKHHELECLEAIERDSEGYRAVTFCTAWGKKDEH